MDRNTILVALGFAALAALFVAIGFRGGERRVEAQAQLAREQLEAQAAAPFTAGLDREDRLLLALGCALVSFASYLWILVCAFREHLGWGLAVLFGNALGAIVFIVFHPRQSMLPMVLMCGGVGLSWAARLTGAG